MFNMYGPTMTIILSLLTGYFLCSTDYAKQT